MNELDKTRLYADIMALLQEHAFTTAYHEDAVQNLVDTIFFENED
jgi:hypothetical protein